MASVKVSKNIQASTIHYYSKVVIMYIWRKSNQGSNYFAWLPLNVEDIGVVCMSSSEKQQEAVTYLHRGLGLRFVLCDGTRFRSVTHTQGSPPLKSNQGSERRCLNYSHWPDIFLDLQFSFLMVRTTT